MRPGRLVGVVVIIAALAFAGFVVGRALDWQLPAALGGPRCEVTAGGTVRLEPEQTANAATIAAVGSRRDLPDRAVVVALAVALQESKLRNLRGGDRDSAGLFQQRPSQGWGTREQIMDPRHAAGRFYDALAAVPGWADLRVTEAGQAVQRSDHPEAYQKWAADAETLAEALLGNASGALACTLPEGQGRAEGASVDTLDTGLAEDWGDELTSVPSASGVSVRVPNTRAGWRYAHWLVAHADHYGIQRVRYAGQEWTAKSGAWSATTGAAPATEVTAELTPSA